MPLTLLLDLDDTLLDSNMAGLAPAYLKKLSESLASWVKSDELVKKLLASTDTISKNERPDLTLEEIFNQNFYPALNMVDRPDFRSAIDYFYQEGFPSLQEFCTPKPGVVELIEYAFGQGWRVVIATNPIQARPAVEQRLRWAQLPPEKYPFNLITSMENSHFSKATPAYYAEILGALGWPNDPVVMVGDDPVLDIDSASKAGLPVYWIRPADKSLPELVDIPQGTISDFWNWVQTIDIDQLQPDFQKPEALIHAFRSAPAVFDSLLRTLDSPEWTIRPGLNEWALVEIVCHLRDMDVEVNLPRLETLTSEENAFIAGQDTDRWADERQYIKQDGPTAFHEFVAARIKLLEKLNSLSVEDWQRRARHTIFGPTSLQELVRFMAEHDQTHIRQATTLLEIA